MILVPCERVNHPSRSAPPSINLFCGAMATPRIDCLVALFFFFFSSRLLFRRSPHFFCVEVERFALFGCDCNQALFVRLTRTLIKWHGDGRGGFFFCLRKRGLRDGNRRTDVLAQWAPAIPAEVRIESEDPALVAKSIWRKRKHLEGERLGPGSSLICAPWGPVK